MNANRDTTWEAVFKGTMSTETKRCAHCGTRRLAAATFYAGMDQWCAVTTARGLMERGDAVPAELVRAVFASLDAERRNAQEEAREAGRAIQEAEAKWAIEQAENARW